MHSEGWPVFYFRRYIRKGVEDIHSVDDDPEIGGVLALQIRSLLNGSEP